MSDTISRQAAIDKLIVGELVGMITLALCVAARDRYEKRRN